MFTMNDKFDSIAPAATTELDDYTCGWMNGKFYNLDAARPHKTLEMLSHHVIEFISTWKNHALLEAIIACWKRRCLDKPEGDWDGYVFYPKPPAPKSFCPDCGKEWENSPADGTMMHVKPNSKGSYYFCEGKGPVG